MGTVYSIEELLRLSAFCKKHDLVFHIDGARLPNAANTLGVSLKSITTDVGADIISFGGTKNGMMLGEAVVFLNPKLAHDFKFIRKQGLQLASKQRFLAAPFIEYLNSGLYQEIASHVCTLAKYLEESVQNIPGVEILAPVQSNAVFAKIPKSWNKPLKDKFFFYVWDEFANSVRWMITWDHTKQDIDNFVAAIRSCSKV
jgi:threonine aldolase